MKTRLVDDVAALTSAIAQLEAVRDDKIIEALDHWCDHDDLAKAAGVTRSTLWRRYQQTADRTRRR